MKRLPLIGMVMALAGLQGCDLDSSATAKREVDNFHGIAVGAGIEVVVHQGEQYSVKVSSDSGDIDGIQTTVEDGKLIITKSRSWMRMFNWFDWWSDYNAEVTLPKLDYLSNRGGARVKFTGEFTGDTLEIIASGGGDIDLTGHYRSITIRSSGGSSTKLTGEAQTFEARSSGGSSIRAMNLEVEEADLISSGGSNIGITVLNKIKARASGGSSVRYGGHPAATDINSSGGANIRATNK